MPDSPVAPKPFLDGWRTVLGSLALAMGGAFALIDFAKDTPQIITGKLLAAFGVWLTGVGMAGKSDKSTAATVANTEAIKATATPLNVFQLSADAKGLLLAVSAGIAPQSPILAAELAALAK